VALCRDYWQGDGGALGIPIPSAASIGKSTVSSHSRIGFGLEFF
jgi:hypothetical protein